MPRSVDPEEAIYYNAIQDVCAELAKQADNAGARRMSRELERLLRQARNPLGRQRAITRSLETVEDDPAAKRALMGALAAGWGGETFRQAGFQPTPGSGSAIRPGPLLVCPLPGCPYAQYEMQKGEEYRCEYHPNQILIRKRFKKRQK